MSYLRKDAVMSSIKTRNIGKEENPYLIFEAYLGTDPYSKKPVRIASRNMERLHKKVTEFFKRISAGGDFAVLLSPAQSVDARKAIDMLKENNVNISLTECVSRYVNSEKSDTKQCSITLSDAFDEYMRRQEGKSDSHVKAVASRVGRWVGFFGGTRPVSDVTPKEVADELERRLFSDKTEEQKTTYNNHLNYIKTFMQWCASSEQGYVSVNPIADMKLKVKCWRDKEYLHSEDCELLFRYLERRTGYETDLANCILSFFCGMRQAEIERVYLGSSAVVINLEERFIRVIACKGATKGIQPRVFTIPDTAYEWMKSFDFMKAVMMKNMKFREHLNKIAKEAKIARLPDNAGRHTFCTMFDAAYHDQVQLSAIAGNSEDVRAKHYNGLATEKEGKAFFAILPSASVTPTDSSSVPSSQSDVAPC